jgi:pimeloyl-ACP methyl ester carboxylesterase
MSSANRYYAEDLMGPGPEGRARVPLEVSLTAAQSFERPPREYVERLYPDIRRWIELPRGGHFIALEETELLAEVICAFFRPLR